MEEIGYDRQERLYFVLDDNRLYRRTDPPLPKPPPAKPKANSKKARAAARAAKRRKVIEDDDDDDEDGDTPHVPEQNGISPGAEEDSFAGRRWECIAVTLPEYREFLSKLSTRDLDEKDLHQHITNDVLPIIEKAEEALLRKQQRMEREMQTLHKMATAKRSSRLAGKQEREQAEREAAEAEAQRKADLEAALRDQERQKSMAEQRESRMMTREQRLKDREYKRILHEEELKKLAEDEQKADAGEARLSERHLKAEMAKRKRELEELQQEDEWTFGCSVCGVYGENLVGPCVSCAVPPHCCCVVSICTKTTPRTMALTAWLAKNAMSGSIPPVLVSPSPLPNPWISTLFVASAKPKPNMQHDPNQPLSSLGCQGHHLLRLTTSRITAQKSACHQNVRAMMRPIICHQ